MFIPVFRKVYGNYRERFFSLSKNSFMRNGQILDKKMDKNYVKPSINRHLYKVKVKLNVPNNTREALLSVYSLKIPQSTSVSLQRSVISTVLLSDSSRRLQNMHASFSLN